MLRLSNVELTADLQAEALANPALRLQIPEPVPQLALFAEQAPPPSRRPTPTEPSLGFGGGLAEQLGIAAAPDLHEHLQAQARLLLSSAEDLRIAGALALAVSPWGWLDVELDEIASDVGAPLARVEAVLTRLQQMEPAGLLARSLSECLRLQARDQDYLCPRMEIVLDRLDLLAAGRLDELAALMGTGPAEVLALHARIRSFDPKPGLRFDAAPLHEVEPDLIVRRQAGGWSVALNRSTLPEVEVAEDAEAGQRRAALLLVGAVARRNCTLLRIGEEIVRRQGDWLLHGPARLAPMSLSGLAESLGLHETTVGRIVAGRMMATPRGAVALRSLCSTAIPLQGGGEISATALRFRIAAMIRDEGRIALSDEAIARRLAREGIGLARRTVAKYRAQMRIPAARDRMYPT